MILKWKIGLQNTHLPNLLWGKKKKIVRIGTFIIEKKWLVVMLVPFAFSEISYKYAFTDWLFSFPVLEPSLNEKLWIKLNQSHSEIQTRYTLSVLSHREVVFCEEVDCDHEKAVYCRWSLLLMSLTGKCRIIAGTCEYVCGGWLQRFPMW